MLRKEYLRRSSQWYRRRMWYWRAERREYFRNRHDQWCQCNWGQTNYHFKVPFEFSNKRSLVTLARSVSVEWGVEVGENEWDPLKSGIRKMLAQSISIHYCFRGHSQWNNTRIISRRYKISKGKKTRLVIICRKHDCLHEKLKIIYYWNEENLAK